MPGNKLAAISAPDSSTKAVIFVGGIHDTYHHFDSWAESLSGPDTAVYGFDHNHSSSTMTAAGHQLADAIRGLQDEGITDVQVVAHSMGGLVAKAALNELAATGEAASFEHLQLDALGTPWGGFVLADTVDFVPGGQFFSELAGFPMAREMGPHSDFMKALPQEWPENMTFNVYHGTADSVARPETSFTQERFDANTAGADSVTLIEGFQHTDFVKAGAELLQASQGEMPPGFEQAEDAGLKEKAPTSPVSRIPGAPAEEDVSAQAAEAEMEAEMEMSL